MCCLMFGVLCLRWDGTISVEGESSGSCPEEAIYRYMRHRHFLNDIPDIYNEQDVYDTEYQTD